MIQLTLQLHQIIQEWIRREIIDFDPYDAEAHQNHFVLYPEKVEG